jgi:hypothetical protein
VNVGKRNKVRSVGVTLAWLVVMGACGSRNALPGGLAVDDDGAVNGAGGNNSSGPGVDSAHTGFATTVASTVSASTGMAASGPASVTSFGSSVSTGSGFGGSTTGFGGAPTCDFGDNAGGEGGGAGVPVEPASCDINFCDGWAPREGNCADIQGAFYTYADELNGGPSSAYITTSTTNLICVAGYVGQVIDGQYDVYWGAGLGMNLNQPDITAERQPYDADYNGVTGFGFWFSYSTFEGEVRFTVRSEDDYYCETVRPGGGYSEFSLADLTKGCWSPVGTPHDYSRLMSIEWHFVSNSQAGYSFEICLSGLTAYR